MEYNIFTELGFEASEAEDLLNRSKAMAKLKDFINENGSRSALLLNVPPNVIEDLVMGRIDRFGMGRLNSMLSHIPTPNKP